MSRTVQVRRQQNTGEAKEIFDEVLPKLPESVGPGDNAIQQVTVSILGPPDIGKSNCSRWIVEKACEQYGKENVDVQVAQAENLGRLLDPDHWTDKLVQIRVCENLTYAKLRDEDLRDFFRIREFMERYAHRRSGLSIVIFTFHQFPHSAKSVRNSDCLITLRIPKCDKDILEEEIGKSNVAFLERTRIKLTDTQRPAIITFRALKPAFVMIPRIRPEQSFMYHMEQEHARTQPQEHSSGTFFRNETSKPNRRDDIQHEVPPSLIENKRDSNGLLFGIAGLLAGGFILQQGLLRHLTLQAYGLGGLFLAASATLIGIILHKKLQRRRFLPGGEVHG
jgi:hypothetical protein